MLVHELMSTPAVCLRLGSDLQAAVEALASHQISAVPIVDAGGAVVGIISEADLLAQRLTPDPRVDLGARPGPREPWHHTVDETMTPDPVVTGPDGDVAEVADLLAQSGWKSLPVVDEHHHVIGVISRSDIVRALAAPDAEIAARVRADFVGVGGSHWSVSVREGVVSVRGAAPGREAMLATVVARAAPGVRRVMVEPPAADPPPANPADEGERLALRNLRRWPRQTGDWSRGSG